MTKLTKKLISLAMLCFSICASVCIFCKGDNYNTREKIVRIFFTGGFDSTYRFVQLSQLEGIVIQPYYLYFMPGKKNEERQSRDYEMKAIEEVISKLQNDTRTKAKIMPVKVTKSSDLKKEDRLPYNRINHRISTLLKGSDLLFQPPQYGHFAYLCEKLQIKDVELGIIADDMATRVIKKHAKLLKKHDNIIGDYYIVAKPGTDASEIYKLVYDIYKYYRFPLIDTSKLDIERLYKETGYADMMDLTWTCYSPIDEKPCGKCYTCRQAIKEGLVSRFDDAALKRYAEYMRKRNNVAR